MKRLSCSLLMLAFLAGSLPFLGGCNGARDTALSMVGKNGKVGFNIRTLVRGDRQRKYGLFVPLHYSAGQKYPVIVFLHGVGEGGSDSQANLRVGLAPFVADSAQNFGFICIFPQSSNGQWDADSDNAKDVIAEIDDVAKDYSIDADRVSLTGLSTGGYGTWAIGATYKSRFAALVPMGSSADPRSYAPQLLNIPIRSYHNGGDPFAAIWNDTNMVDKIKELGGNNCTFTKTDGPGHDCWEGVYSQGELFTWLLQQRRNVASPSANMGGNGAIRGGM